MNIGSFAKRSIANQKMFSFELDFVFSNSTGVCELGFSGNTHNFDFLCQNGQIYGPNGEYVWSYSPNEKISVSGDWVSGNYNYFINEVPIEIKNNGQTGYFSEFYINPQGVSVDLDVFVKGKTPRYSIHFPTSILTGSIFTGYILNEETDPDLAFKIFSGGMNGDPTPFTLVSLPSGVNIWGGQSGQIIFSHSGEGLDALSTEVFLNTNFGLISHFPNTQTSGSPFEFLSFIQTFTGLTGESYYSYNVFDYNLGVIADELQSLSVYAYDGGGNTDIITGEVPVTGIVSGEENVFVHVYLALTMPRSGWGQSIYPDESGNIPQFLLEDEAFFIQFATGDIVYNYNVLVNSVESGALPSFACTGFISGEANGLIVGSGFLTGLNFGEMTGSFFGYDYVDETFGILKLLQYATGNFTYTYSGFASGIGVSALYTGDMEVWGTGSVNFDITGLTGLKRLVGIFGYDAPNVFEYDFPLVPQLTSAILPSGEASSSLLSVSNVWIPFSRIPSFETIVTPSTGYIQYEFPAGMVTDNPLYNARGYSVLVETTDSNSFSGFRVMGSNDGSSWQTLQQTASPTFVQGRFRALNDVTGNFDFLRLEFSGGATLKQINFFNNITATGIGYVSNILSNQSGQALSSHYGSNNPPIRAFDGSNSTFFRGINVGNPASAAVFIRDDVGFLTEDIGANAGEFHGVTGDGTYNYYWGDFFNAFGAVRSNFVITNKNHEPQFQTVEDDLNISTEVFGFAKSGDTFYLATPGLKKVDNFSSVTDLNISFNGNGGDVFSLCPTQNGLFIGGDFTSVTAGAQTWTTSGLAKANTQGVFDASFRTHLRGGLVKYLEEYDGGIFVGGSFDALMHTGTNTHHLVSTKADNVWDFSGMNSGLNDTVRFVLHSGDRVFVAGDFSAVGGDSQKRGIVAYSTDGTLLPFRANVNGQVYSLAISGSTLFAGGTFSSARGVTRTGLCAFDILESGGSGNLLPWAPRLNSTSVRPNEFIYDSGIIYMGGDFTSVNGVSKGRFAKIDINGNVDPLNVNFNGAVLSLEKRGDDIFVGGDFTTVGGIGRNRLAMVSSAGLLSPWNPSATSSVRAITQGSSGEIYVGGDFVSLSGNTQYIRYGKFLPNLALDPGFTGEFLDTVNDIYFDNDKLFVVGGFEGVRHGNGITTNLNGSLNYLSGWLPDSNGIDILKVTKIQDRLWLMGDFFNVGYYCPNLMKLNYNGSPDVQFCPLPDDSVSGFAFSGDHMYVAGVFDQLRGESSIRLAHLNLPNGESGTAIGGINHISSSANLKRVRNVSGDIYVMGFVDAINGEFSDPVIRLVGGDWDEDYGAKVSRTVNDIYFEPISGGHIVVGNITGEGVNTNLTYFFGSGSGKHVDYYKIRPEQFTPSFFITYGSNDAVSWELLDVRQGLEMAEGYDFFFKNPSTGVFDYFKLNLGYGSGYSSTLPYTDIVTFSLYGDDGDFLSVLNHTFTGTGFYSNEGFGFASGNLTGLSGLQPGVGQYTGVVSGTIEAGSGHYLFYIVRSGAPDAVFLDYEIDSTPATGAFYFPSGFEGLSGFNVVVINNVGYSSDNELDPPGDFNSLESLVSLINSGSSGYYGSPYDEVHVHATLDGTTIFLESEGVFGESGNLIDLTFSSTLDGSILTSGPYLRGGASVRPEAEAPYYSTYTGFSEFVLANNSGFYNLISEAFRSDTQTGVIYRDRFDLSWLAESGISNSGLYNIPWVPSENAFSGESIIDARENLQDIIFQFSKHTPFGELSGSLIYEIRIGDNIFTGQIYA